MTISSVPILIRYGICAFILCGCSYIILEAFRNFLDLTFLYTYRRKPGIGIGYLCMGIFFFFAAAAFVFPNYRYVFAWH